jgi:hypothetical protein
MALQFCYLALQVCYLNEHFLLRALLFSSHHSFAAAIAANLHRVTQLQIRRSHARSLSTLFF